MSAQILPFKPRRRPSPWPNSTVTPVRLSLADWLRGALVALLLGVAWLFVAPSILGTIYCVKLVLTMLRELGAR